MVDSFCKMDSAVIRAAKLGSFDPSLRAHVEACPICSTTVKLVSAIASAASVEMKQAPLPPDPQRLWLKAAFVERQRRSAMITRIASVAYAALAAAIGLGIYSLLNSRSGNAAPTFAIPEFSMTSTVPAILLIACVLLALLLSTPLSKRAQ